MKHRVADGDQGKEQAERQHQSAQHHSQPKRLIAKAENRVHGVLEKLEQGLLRLTRGAVMAFVIYKRSRKSYPGAETGKITISLLQVDNGVSRLPVQQPKNPRIQGNGKVRDEAHHFIKQRKQPAADSSFGAAGPFRNYYFGAVLPRFHQFGQDLGRVLKIAIHQHDGVTPGSLQSSREGRLVAEVAGQFHDTEVRVLVLD